MANWFLFQARLGRVVDGDTIDMIVDLGFRARYEARVRLEGVDAAEIYGVALDSEEYAWGMEHKAFVEDWFDTHTIDDAEWPLILNTEEDSGKYGRWPGSISAKDTGADLAGDLVAEFPEVADSD